MRTTGLCLRIMFSLLVISLFISCQSAENTSTDEQIVEPRNSAKSGVSAVEQNYIRAKEAYQNNPNDADALIWYGRRAAYLGNFEEAIDIYSTGIVNHPDDVRMLRHRGHRYITLRQYDKAIVDFEAAVTLIDGKIDQVEPDGLPNARNTPIGTLHGNIWYHLGLAYYLQNDMENALRAYSNRTVTEKYDDNAVSGGHWLYMILRRMGRDDDANRSIEGVHAGMDIIENFSYFQMCQFYKGDIKESDLQPKESNSPSDDVLDYGLGNWHLYNNQDTVKAKQYYRHLFKNGNKSSFAYLAAESDWIRLFGELPH